ncbi:hypothetical protein C6P46_002023, partial [Rhodotorula mucilaginosa]
MPDTGIDLLGYWKSEAQAAFDQATRQYKIRIGNRSAWSRFHGQLNLSLGRMTRLTGRELPYTGVREHVEVELRNLEGHLRVLADGPELLALSLLRCETLFEDAPENHTQPSQIELFQLKNHYDDDYFLKVQQGAVEAARDLKREVEACIKLGSDDKLQRALNLMGAEYRARRMNSKGEALQAQLVWDGICRWLSRCLGPIPAAVRGTEAFQGLLEALDVKSDWHQQLYFKHKEDIQEGQFYTLDNEWARLELVERRRSPFHNASPGMKQSRVLTSFFVGKLTDGLPDNERKRRQVRQKVFSGVERRYQIPRYGRSKGRSDRPGCKAPGTLRERGATSEF